MANYAFLSMSICTLQNLYLGTALQWIMSHSHSHHILLTLLIAATADVCVQFGSRDSSGSSD
jgi:hypothetical protein